MTAERPVPQARETTELAPDIAVMIKNIATALIQRADAKPGKKVSILYYHPKNPMVSEVERQLLEKGAEVAFIKRDQEEMARVLPDMSAEEIDRFFDKEKKVATESTFMIRIGGSENPEAMKDVPTDKMTAYRKRIVEIHQSNDYIIFLWPTRYEAAQEGLGYDEYLKTCLEACDQDWPKINRTQELLKQKLNQGKFLELVANQDDPDSSKRTNVTMSIEGMTFANSTIAKNYPGSEVFSAPVMDSVNGQVFAPGKYLYDNQLMEDIFLKILDGKVIEASARTNNEGLQQILSRGEGARYFGEIGIGTNPGLKTRLLNSLLCEKVSGSFHLALGFCPNYTEYLGEPISIINGNTEDRTPNHWDITVLMHPKDGGGKIILDGEVIQENGVFTDPQLAILNPKP